MPHVNYLDKDGGESEECEGIEEAVEKQKWETIYI